VSVLNPNKHLIAARSKIIRTYVQSLPQAALVAALKRRGYITKERSLQELQQLFYDSLEQV